MEFATWRTSRADLIEEVGKRQSTSPLSRRWWKTLGVAATLVCVATAGTAATFSLTNGEVIEGEIVQATRNTIVVREDTGSIRQLSRRKVESMRVETKKGQTITGPLTAWTDGTYEIEYGGRLVQVRDRRILKVVPIPQETVAVAAAEPAAEPAGSEAEPAAAEQAAPPTEPLSSTSAAIEIETPRANPDEPEPAAAEPAAAEPAEAGATDVEPAGVETAAAEPAEAETAEADAADTEPAGTDTAEADKAEAETVTPVQSAELTTATIADEAVAPAPAPADPEAQAHSDGDPPPRLIVSEGKAGENASELVFKVDLSRPVDQPIMILYATYDRTAIAGEDYKGERGTMTIPPGASSAVVRVPLIDDDVQEENETLELFVATDERKATIESDRIVGTILNDDN